MALALKKEEDYYTYTDFLEWDEDFRAEIIRESGLIPRSLLRLK
jgi:hypothetical protein